ncbi:hypothetical protein [Streptomyces sp. NPDC088757]|uniref:hypothetical protein n=1 Tax=Streptomyces sp. NPDC088757 TaxID=3365889 RepID=UPI00381CD807
MTAPDWIVPVLVGAFLAFSYRVVRRSGVGFGTAALFMVVLNAGLLWTLRVTGPPRAVPVVAVVSLLAAAASTFAAVRAAVARIERVDPPRFRDLVRAVAGAPGPQVMGVCVSPRGALVLTAFGDDARPEGRQFHLAPGAHCPFCLVEDQVRDFLGPEDPLLHEYRTHLAHGSSRHLLVRRASPAEPWTGRLRDRVHYRTPAPSLRPPCPVHDPLLNTARQ